MTWRRLQQLQNIFEQVASLLAQHSETEEIASELLRLLGKALGCDWGTYWEVDFRLGVLRPAATWHAKGISAPRLEKHTHSRTLTLSQGTAGHVWRSRKPIWTQDLILDMCLPRSLDADNAGLHGGVWFAVKTDRTVYGVFELLGRNLPPATEELLVGIEAFGMRLGNLLEEKWKNKTA